MRRIARTLVTVATIWSVGALGLAETPQWSSSDEDLVFVTEDLAFVDNHPGCDAVSVFDFTSGMALRHGDTHVSPGRLAVSDDLNTALATQSNTRRFVYVLGRRPGQPTRWQVGTIVMAPFATLGGIAVLPAGDSYVVATESSGIYEDGPDERLPNLPPFYVKKYRMPSSIVDGRLAGPVLGSFRTDGVAVEILPTYEGALLHVLTSKGVIHTLDSASMAEVAAPIRQAAFAGPPSRVYDGAEVALHGTLTADEHYLVSNRWATGELNAADLERRTSAVLPAGIALTGGVAANRAWTNKGLLAVHAGSEVAVISFVPGRQLAVLGRAPVRSPDVAMAVDTGPFLAIAWNGTGSRIIAATDDGPAEFAVFDVRDDGRSVTFAGLLSACREGRNYANDIVSANGRLGPPVLTPTSAPTGSPTSSTTPAPSVTPTITRTPTVSPAPSRSATVTDTVTAPPEPVPPPIYLPVTLRERCSVDKKRADVALVLDTSSSMTGQKLTDARSAATAFVRLMDLTPDRDQVAIVHFDTEVEVVQELASDRARIEQAIAGLTARQGNCIDKGLRAALGELTSARRNPANLAVAILLTDGVHTGGAGADRIAAGEVRAAGVRLYTIGLGGDVDAVALVEMAGDARRYHFAPDSAALSDIYKEIASDIQCPAPTGGFWRRK